MKKKRLKLKKGKVLCALILLLATIDLFYLFYNMFKGIALTWFGCLTLCIDIILVIITYEELREEYERVVNYDKKEN